MERLSGQRSLLLSGLRAIAAQAVCIGHALSFAGLYPVSLVPIQNLGVVVFFLLSGFVIADTLTRTRSFLSFFIDRFVRIYIAYVPALMLVAAIDGALIAAGLHQYPDYLSLRAFAGNLLMLQGWNGPPALIPYLRVGTLGSDGPLWTIAIEWHIYLFVGATWFALAKQRPALLGWAFVFGFLPLTYLVGDVQPGLGTGLLALWLMGFATRFVLPVVVKMPRWALAGVGIPAAIAYLVVIGTNVYVPWSYPLFAIAFAAAVSGASNEPPPGWLRGPTEWTAGYSLSLYLVHYPILYALSRLHPDGGALLAAAGIVVSNAVAIAVAAVSERHYRAVRDWLRARTARATAPLSQAER